MNTNNNQHAFEAADTIQDKNPSPKIPKQIIIYDLKITTKINTAQMNNQ